MPQPFDAFGVDGVIMFSDILTPLPALGIEFDVISGKGPVIHNPITDRASVDALRVSGRIMQQGMHGVSGGLMQRGGDRGRLWLWAREAESLC